MRCSPAATSLGKPRYHLRLQAAAGIVVARRGLSLERGHGNPQRPAEDQ